jgi:SnoaL-like domain
MKTLSALFWLSLAGSAALAQSPAQRVSAVLDDWHHAAAVADEARYFGHFAPDAVFMGTDPTERWTLNEFRVWARPYFAKGKAWNFKPRDRHIEFSRDALVAWFDEMLDTTNLGLCRGSGVLVLDQGVWKISQYNLSIPIPNALADAIVKQIAAAGK